MTKHPTTAALFALKDLLRDALDCVEQGCSDCALRNPQAGLGAVAGIDAAFNDALALYRAAVILNRENRT